MKKMIVCVLLLLFISIKVINAEVIEYDCGESLIRKYFNIQKIIWTFDDYYFHLNHHPPHKGFDGLSSQINNFSVTVQYNGTIYSWQEAVNNSIVLGSVYNWNAANQNYELIDVLQPGLGYWMYAYYNCKLLRADC